MRVSFQERECQPSKPVSATTAIVNGSRQGFRQAAFQTRAYLLSRSAARIVTERLRGDPAAKAEISVLANVKYVFVIVSSGVNNVAKAVSRCASVRSAISGFLNARRRSCRVANRSGSTSRSGDICCGLAPLQATRRALCRTAPFHCKDQGVNAIGVILSGSGSDGALGLQAVQHEGGITFAQDVATARFNSMPRAAIGLACAHF